MLIRQCPVTSGRPTTMTIEGFSRHCKRHWLEARAAKMNATGGNNSSVNTYCVDECHQQQPRELTVKTKDEMMTTKTCTHCHETKAIKARGLCQSCYYEQVDKPMRQAKQIAQDAGLTADSLPINGGPSPAVAEALEILQADRDTETLPEVCRARMDTMNHLGRECDELRADLNQARHEIATLQLALNKKCLEVEELHLPTMPLADRLRDVIDQFAMAYLSGELAA